MSPKTRLKIIGIRPGEKLHEVLSSKDESSFVIGFKKYYIITPNNLISNPSKKYLKNYKKEIGKYVAKDFEYNSRNNEEFLSEKEIKKLNKNNAINDTL